MVPGVFLHVIGAETLKRGDPIDIGWTPALALSLAVLLLTLTTRLQHWFTPIALGVPVALIAAKLVLAAMPVTSSIGAALCLIATIHPHVSRQPPPASPPPKNPGARPPPFDAPPR